MTTIAELEAARKVLLEIGESTAAVNDKITELSQEDAKESFYGEMVEKFEYFYYTLDHYLDDSVRDLLGHLEDNGFLKLVPTPLDDSATAEAEYLDQLDKTRLYTDSDGDLTKYVDGEWKWLGSCGDWYRAFSNHGPFTLVEGRHKLRDYDQIPVDGTVVESDLRDMYVKRDPGTGEVLINSRWNSLDSGWIKLSISGIADEEALGDLFTLKG